MLFSKLRNQGVLGMNCRNISLIARHNRRAHYPNADSKIMAKRLAQQAGIPVPELYRCIEHIGDLRRLHHILDGLDDFVVKPDHGSGGEGVLVLARASDGTLTRLNGEPLSLASCKLHIANIIHGLFSLGGQPDSALIEYRVRFDPVFDELSYRGVPDIRVIVFLGIPLMAMMRLPTRQSGGRANLHQGAIGVGISLDTGITRGGVQGSTSISTHPDSHVSIQGITIPHFHRILSIASRSYEIFGLGYLGVDIVLDEHRGPMVLEVNVRPGLAIQLANGIGLRNRVDAARKEASNLHTTSERVAFAQEMLAQR